MKPVQTIEVSVLGGDVNILVRGLLQYATLENGLLEGLQCNFGKGTEEYNELVRQCRKVHEAAEKIINTIENESE